MPHGPISLDIVVNDYKHLLDTVEKHKSEHIRWQEKADGRMAAHDLKHQENDIWKAGVVGRVVGIAMIGGPLTGILTALILKWLHL